MARCHLVAGEAVTAEGLFRAALDGLPGVAEEADDIAKSQRSAGAVALPVLFASPLHPYSKAAMLRGYSELLMQWEKREAEGEATARQAKTVSATSLASLDSLMPCWSVGAVTCYKREGCSQPTSSVVFQEQFTNLPDRNVAPRRLIRLLDSQRLLFGRNFLVLSLVSDAKLQGSSHEP